MSCERFWALPTARSLRICPRDKIVIVTPELTVDSSGEAPKQIPSTAGMTTKVVKGSMWTLAGSVAPLAVSFISTPFIIRFLGTESYGVLLLVGLIPTYFSFADFGMGVASTKFASEAYGQGDEKKEAEVVWTATAIAAISALIVAIPIFLFSYPIVKLMNVPEHLLATASIALKITSGSFFLGILSSVLNSPMLARLRMDLNMLTSAIPKILLAVVTPLILYFGGGIVEAVSWALIVAIGIVAVVVYFSARLLPELTSISLNRDLLRPLLKFGGAWFIAMVAAMLLANLEKFVLTSLVSVKALAYYSVAFTLANMATIFAQAMIQALIPAFSQLQDSDTEAELHALFARGVRLNLIWVLPALSAMFIGAETFFRLWVGEEFAHGSTVPFYILLGGLLFNVLAYVPHASVVAAGRTDLFAKLYWFELAFYAIAAWLLISTFGIIGAALAWSLRAILDAFVVIALSKRKAGMTFRFFDHFSAISFGVGVLIIPTLLFALTGAILISGAAFIVALAIYSAIIWNWFIDADERSWITGRLRDLLDFS